MRIGGQEILIPTSMAGNYPNPRWWDASFARYFRGDREAEPRFQPAHGYSRSCLSACPELSQSPGQTCNPTQPPWKDYRNDYRSFWQQNQKPRTNGQLGRIPKAQKRRSPLVGVNHFESVALESETFSFFEQYFSTPCAVFG